MKTKVNLFNFKELKEQFRAAITLNGLFEKFDYALEEEFKKELDIKEESL